MCVMVPLMLQYVRGTPGQRKLIATEIKTTFKFSVALGSSFKADEQAIRPARNCANAHLHDPPLKFARI